VVSRWLVGLATVRPAVTRTVASFRLAPGGPPPVVLLELRVLSVGQRPGRVFAISPCREYEPLLQALVLLPFRAPIAERVGEEAGHHGKGREIARHADVVDPDTAEGDERRLEVNDEPAMLLRHSALPSL